MPRLLRVRVDAPGETRTRRRVVAVLEGDNIWGDVHDIADPPDIKTERLQHYFSTYKMVPGKEVDIKVDFVYGREEALKVIAASEAS